MHVTVNKELLSLPDYFPCGENNAQSYCVHDGLTSVVLHEKQHSLTLLLCTKGQPAAWIINDTSPVTWTLTIRKHAQRVEHVEGSITKLADLAALSKVWKDRLALYAPESFASSMAFMGPMFSI